MSYFQYRNPLRTHSCPLISNSQGMSIQHLIYLDWQNIGINGLYLGDAIQLSKAIHNPYTPNLTITLTHLSTASGSRR
jgi:hypothetical protein